METYNKLKPITYKITDFQFRVIQIKTCLSKSIGYGFINWVAVGQFTGNTNLLDGVGILVDWIGCIKEGYWEDGRLHGEGKYITGGDYYIGNFKDGKFNGEGTYFYKEGIKYVGHLKDNKRYGQGTQYTKDGEIMKQGNWADSLEVWKYNPLLW